MDFTPWPPPPYTVTHSTHLSPQQFQQCRALALACDLFYNTGRSMAYFLPLCRASQLSAVEFLDHFGRWLVEQHNERECNAAIYSPEQVFAMQQSFIEALFHQQQVENVIPIALDLIRFHTRWADTLLGYETLACQQVIVDKVALLEQCWCLAPTLRVEIFNYDVDEIGMLADVDLVEFVELSEQSGSTGLFLRRGEEVYCESIDDVFATLLLQSDGATTPTQIMAPFLSALTVEDCADLVHFAVSEGLLVPPVIS